MILKSGIFGRPGNQAGVSSVVVGGGVVVVVVVVVGVVVILKWVKNIKISESDVQFFKIPEKLSWW